MATLLRIKSSGSEIAVAAASVGPQDRSRMMLSALLTADALLLGRVHLLRKLYHASVGNVNGPAAAATVEPQLLLALVEAVYAAAGGGADEMAAVQAWRQYEQSFEAQQQANHQAWTQQQHQGKSSGAHQPWKGPPPTPPPLPARETCPVCVSPLPLECVHAAICDQGHAFRRCPQSLLIQQLHMRDIAGVGAVCGSQCIALPSQSQSL
jgi:hypothetical protein